jgi:uncharacterized membrane protein YjjP (DUF1212 family)
VFIVGSLLNFTAFAFAPQSVLASLEGIQVGALNLFRFCFFGCFFCLLVFAFCTKLRWVICEYFPSNMPLVLSYC